MPRPVDPNVVIAKVGEWFHVTREEIVNGGQELHIARARRFALRLIHDLSGYSWSSATTLVGNIKPSGTNGATANAQRLPNDEVAEVEAFVREAS